MTALSPSFWAHFVERHWQREPVVLHGAALAGLASASEVFATLLTLAARLHDGDNRIEFRFNRAGVPSETPERFLPRPSDGSSRAYTERMQRELSGDDFGIIVNDFQALSPTLWDRASAFLRGLYDVVGLPPGGAVLDLFMGNYRRTFLGLHKDSQDVFTFVVEGKKTALLWPFELLREVAKAPASVRGEPFVLGAMDYERFRDRAIVLSGEPGDLLYWPASYWHVIEGDGSLATTLSLGLFLHDDPIARLAAVRGSEFPLGSARVHPHHLGLAGIRPVLQVPSLQAALEERLLARLTSDGFKKAPDLVEAPPLRDGERVQLTNPIQLAWLERDTSLTWAAQGRVYNEEPLQLASLLRALCEGEAQRVKVLRKHARNAGLPLARADAVLTLLLRLRALRLV